MHRHRCAPEPWSAHAALVASGALRILAGRLSACRTLVHGCEAEIQPRGRSERVSSRYDVIVNCTGPASDVRRIEDPLLRHLLATGLVRTDALGLGLDTTEDGRLVASDGRPHRVLHHVSPLLRGRDWEATPVPELRAHAARLAHALAAALDAG